MEYKYLKTWTGVTSGSYAGRDDGYPEEKSQSFRTIDELARTYGTKRNEKYYVLEDIDNKTLMAAVEKSLSQQKEVAKEKKKEKINNKIAEMQKELKELN